MALFSWLYFPNGSEHRPGIRSRKAAESPSLSNERDIAAEEKALLNESTDLEEMAKSLKGAEFDAPYS